MDIAFLFVVSFWCFGVYNLFDENMLLGGLAGRIRVLTGSEWDQSNVVTKPLFDCVMCMASIHGFTSYTIVHGLDWMVIPFIVCLSGLNWLLLHLTLLNESTD